MVIDDQDRLLITEYRGNKLALFDTKSEKVTEYLQPPYTFPYRATTDKNGELWSGGMHTDRAVRFNPKTGETVEYQLPHETNMRTVLPPIVTTATAIPARTSKRTGMPSRKTPPKSMRNGADRCANSKS